MAETERDTKVVTVVRREEGLIPSFCVGYLGLACCTITSINRIVFEFDLGNKAIACTITTLLLS